MRRGRVDGLDTLRWDCKQMGFGSSLRADDGESKRMVGDAHDEPVDRRRSGPDVLGTQGKPLCVGWDEAVPRLMAGPDADATSDGGAWTVLGRTGHSHGAEWETRRQVGETREGLHFLLGRNGPWHDAIFDTLEA